MQGEAHSAVNLKNAYLASIGGIGVPGSIAKDNAENLIPLFNRAGISKSCPQNKKNGVCLYYQKSYTWKSLDGHKTT